MPRRKTMSPDLVSEQVKAEAVDRLIFGFVDYVDSFRVSGWAIGMSGAVRSQVVVGLFFKGEICSVSLAKELRVDLRNPDCLEGYVGFDFVNPLGSVEGFSSYCDIRVVDENGNASDALPNLVTKDVATGEQQAFPPATQLPVFIVGAARSGTSAIHRALSKCTGWPSFGEGHVFPLAEELVRTVSNYRARADFISPMGVSLLPQSVWTRALVSYFRELYQVSFSGKVWIDKTPGLPIIRLLPLIKECWPNVRFVFMKRRGIENVESALRKFPSVSFVAACDEWAGCMEGWFQVRSDLDGHFIEIDQFDMEVRPEFVADRLSGFLGLERDQGKCLSHELKTEFPELGKSRTMGKAMSLQSTEWSGQQTEYFSRRCSEVMTSCGYSNDESYWCDGKA